MNRKRRIIKRKIYLIIGTVLILALTNVGYAVAQSITDDNVTQTDVKMAAISLIEKMEHQIPVWKNATVSQPTEYLAPDNAVTAYEFTVLSNNDEVGYIIVSARYDWTPILEFSDGKAPSSYLQNAKQIAIEEGYVKESDNSKPKIFYWGACSYSVQLGKEMENSRTGIHLPTGVINQIPQNNPTFQMDSYKSNEAWKDLLGNESEISLETLLQSLFGAKPAIATMQEHSIDVTIETDTTYKMISVVPAYYQSSTHGDGSMVPPPPNYIGIADDPWAIYDGCAPISGAMVIAYWHDHGYPNIPDPSYSGAEDLLIDHCHVEMNTSFFGSTNSYNIGPGIEEVTDNIYFYDFDYDLVVANFNKVQTEIINDRPLVFVLYDSPEYDYHAVCVVGFLDDTWVDFMYVHNTWDTSIHSIAWGAFDIPNSSLVAVYPGS